MTGQEQQPAPGGGGEYGPEPPPPQVITCSGGVTGQPAGAGVPDGD